MVISDKVMNSFYFVSLFTEEGLLLLTWSFRFSHGNNHASDKHWNNFMHYCFMHSESFAVFLEHFYMLLYKT